MLKPESNLSDSPDPIDIVIGKRLKFRRNFMGLTQEALAGKIGVSFQQIQKYESGQNKVAASKLYHISKILGISVEFFFQEDEALTGGKTGLSDQGQDGFDHDEDLINKSETAHLLRAYYDITDKKKRKTALDMLKGLQS